MLRDGGGRSGRRGFGDDADAGLGGGERGFESEHRVKTELSEKTSARPGWWRGYRSGAWAPNYPNHRVPR